MPKEKSAGAVIFRMENGEPYYLLLRYYSGHWEFAKGHIEEGESNEETVKREIEEETGIKIEEMDAKKLIKLLNTFGMNVEISGRYNLDIESKRGKIINVRETINQLESRLGKLIPTEEIEKALEGKISPQDLEDALTQLSKSGDIFRPKKGYIQRT